MYTTKVVEEYINFLSVLPFPLSRKLLFSITAEFSNTGFSDSSYDEKIMILLLTGSSGSNNRTCYG